MKGDVNVEGTSLNFKNEDICVTNMDNNVLVSWDFTIQCDEIAAMVCDGKKGVDCNSSNADLTKASNLKIKIGKIELEFKPEDYLFFDSSHKNALTCRLGDPGAVRGGYLCDNATTKFAVGKLFYERAFPLFSYNKDGSSTLKFLKEYTFPDKHTKNWFLRWGYLLLIILLVSIIVIFVLLILKKKNSSQSEEYQAV